MDIYSPAEDLVIKTRKPYTITKQRERWTEEEHNRFLEALKLYGRAWQRIEEHIGTKTAVQIRSHAQKFFTKLEKEALIKGVPIGQTLDIEIPPPRPKRKPSNPYPRKTGAATPPTQQVGAKDGKSISQVPSFTGKHLLDLEKEPVSEKPGGDDKLGDAKGTQDKDDCQEVFNLFQEAPCASSSANKDSMPITIPPGKTCTLREFVPMMLRTQDETNESCVTFETKGNQKSIKLDAKQTGQDDGTINTSILESSNTSNEKLLQGKKTEEVNQPEDFGVSPSINVEVAQNYPRHVPVHVLNGSRGICGHNVCPDMSYQETMFQHIGGIHAQPNLFTNPAASATTEHHSNTSRASVHQSFSPFHPIFTPIRNNQDDYRSYLHVPPTFSSLILSTLLQNPAAHAAASFAATFWPCTNMDAPAGESPGGTLGGFPSRQINPTPSMAAIAAATVAAATAWWAAHGLLPLCTPFHTGFTCTPATTTGAMTDPGLTAATNNNDKRDRALHDLSLQTHQQLDPEYAEALHEQHSASKSPTLSSSDSEESEGAKPNAGLTTAVHDKAAAVTDHNDSNKTKNRKQVDRSSCGSNTPSSSEVETDALEKHENDKDETKEHDVSHPAGDSCNRRGRSSSSTSDSWKEVSEEGRLAFQKLFSREVLPQSFSPPHDLKNKGYLKNTEKYKQTTDEKDEDASRLNLNSRTWETCPNHQLVENDTLLRRKTDGDGVLVMEVGHGKLKPRRTGFKPYKRCSVEAKESKVACVSNQDEEKDPKRIRLEGEALT